MAEYEDQFQQHPVHEVLDQLEAVLNQKLKHPLDGATPDHLDRLKQSVSFIRQRLEIASPVLNSAARLNGIIKGLQNALTEVNSFVANGNAAHLANASNQVDGPIAAAATLPSLPGESTSVKATDAVSFKKVAEQIIDQLRSQVEETAKSQEKFKNQAIELEEKAKAIQTQLDSVEVTATAKLEEIEATFNSEESERKSDFLKTQKERDQEFSNRLKKLEDSTAESIRAIDEKRKEAERIVQLVGNVGLTGNYKGAGAEEKKTADRLRSQALWCFIGTFVVMAGTLILTAIEGFNPWLAFFRMASALFLLIPGTYAAKESARHRMLENRHRRAELELATIDAYLESLPEDKRSEIKAGLTPKFFGQEVQQPQKVDVTGSALIGLLKDAISALSKK